jgi:hypothetical protein
MGRHAVICQRWRRRRRRSPPNSRQAQSSYACADATPSSWSHTAGRPVRRRPDRGPDDRPPAFPEGDEGTMSRINLRMPDLLKARIKHAAGREGLSVNAWLVRAAAVAPGTNRPVPSTRTRPPCPTCTGSRPRSGAPQPLSASSAGHPAAKRSRPRTWTRRRVARMAEGCEAQEEGTVASSRSRCGVGPWPATSWRTCAVSAGSSVPRLAWTCGANANVPIGPRSCFCQ